MPDRAWKTALVLTLACLASTPVLAQDWKGRGRLQGVVTDPEGQPIEGAKVTLTFAQVLEGGGPESLETNKKGRWSFLGLAGGSWQIVIEYDGYVPSEGQVNVTEFGVNPMIEVELRPIPEEMLAEAAATVVMEAVDDGNRLFTEGKWAEARTAYQTALAEIAAEDQPPVLMGVAQTWAQEGNRAQAITTLKQILAIDAAHAEALGLLAQLYYQEGDVQRAIDTLKTAHEATPDDPRLVQLLVDLLVRADREDEAAEYMDKLPEGQTLSADTVLNLGIDKYNQGELDEALELFNRGVAENPDNPDTYYYRGLTHLGKGKSPEAAADFRKMLELAPEHSLAGEAKQFLEHLESQQ